MSNGKKIQPEHAQDIEKELNWLKELIDLRFNLYFDTGIKPKFKHIEELVPPKLGDSEYAKLIAAYQFGLPERAALALCLAVHLQPQLLDVFFTKNKTFERNFTEFGGESPGKFSGFLPSSETLLFLLAANSIAKRLEYLQLFDARHPLFRFRILELKSLNDGRPRQAGLLELSPEYEARLIHGKTYQPSFGLSFPAQQITSELDWESDLVLPKGTRKQLEEIKLWAKHGDELLNDWGMRKKIRPGYRSLFYGPPGTGKTMSAILLGNETGRAVYRVDLSMVISKYIGETEKNLSKVFDTAEDKNWILFFDEADALFGKRTSVKNAHDRYANQEISYLLQRVETYDGIAILASNLRSNLDEAFSRRFESIIYFPMPRAEERLTIWRQGFPAIEKAQLDQDVDLFQIAEKYELSGGAIMNAVRFASLRALSNGGIIQRQDVLEGIYREFGKEGRSM